MPTLPVPHADNNRSERSFMLGVLALGTMSGILLLVQTLGHARLLGAYDDLVFWAEVVCEIIFILVIAAASPVFMRELRRRRTAAAEAEHGRGRIELLFKMTDMLQSALGHADANSVLRSTAAQLMPGIGGALYVFNNSGDRLELSTSWNWTDDTALAHAIAPSDCWAIKRGKLHLNLGQANSLCCEHHAAAQQAALEIPMMARGEIYGLLILESASEDAASTLDALAPVATALADAMSLSLSSLALRERLRTQALRDPLTGLYNRRYMEDVFERYADQADRNRSPLSVVMIDLDHFKKLNDEHGHAMGDAVLSEVAASLIGAVRPCDVACRYGGEELVVLLPDCGLEEAAAKAELFRARIEQLSDNHGFPISASFGVATIPETSKAKDALADADNALYRAKQEGRNRVVASTLPIRNIAYDKQRAA